MQERKRLVAVVLASCVAATALLGCSDEKSRQAGQNILAKVSEARQLTERAIALMSNPVYEVGSEKLTPPIERKITAEEIAALLPGDVVNPRAWDALDKAFKELSTALSENADAPAADLALGQSMLARIRTVRGDYKRAESLLAMKDALSALNAVSSTAMAMHYTWQTNKELDQLVNAGDKELQGVIANADTAIAEATAQQSKAKDAIAANKKKIEDLNSENEALVTQATQLRSQSDNAVGTKRLELFDRSAELNKKVNDNSLSISSLEQAIADLQAKAQTFSPILVEAKARKEAAEGLLARQKQSQDYYVQEKNKARNILTDTQKKLEEMLIKADAAIVKFSDFLKQANDEYAAAASSYAAAQGKSRDVLGPDALIGQGIAKSRQADLVGQKLGLQAGSLLPLSTADELYTAMGNTAPPALGKIKEYLGADAASLRQIAADLYKDAAGAFRQAVALVPKEQKWAMQAQLAAADAGRYQMAVKDSDKKDALGELNTQLTAALQQKESSPYLQDVVRFRATLIKAGIPIEGAPVSPAAPTPTVPAAPAAAAALAAPAAPSASAIPAAPSMQAAFAGPDGFGAPAASAPAPKGDPVPEADLPGVKDAVAKLADACKSKNADLVAMMFNPTDAGTVRTLLRGEAELLKKFEVLQKAAADNSIEMPKDMQKPSAMPGAEEGMMAEMAKKLSGPVTFVKRGDIVLANTPDLQLPLALTKSGDQWMPGFDPETRPMLQIIQEIVTGFSKSIDEMTAGINAKTITKENSQQKFTEITDRNLAPVMGKFMASMMQEAMKNSGGSFKVTITPQSQPSP